MVIFKDLLKNPETGKYSRKSVNWLVGSLLFVGLVLYHVISGEHIQEGMIWATLAYSGINGALTVWDKNRHKIREYAEIQ